jgi:hypothetical protein
MSQPFGHDIPRLSWLGGKTYTTHFASRKNRSGNSDLHREAIAENESRGQVKVPAEIEVPTPAAQRGVEIGPR